MEFTAPLPHSHTRPQAPLQQLQSLPPRRPPPPHNRRAKLPPRPIHHFHIALRRPSLTISSRLAPFAGELHCFTVPGLPGVQDHQYLSCVVGV
jgi:hypothetical protein